MTAAIAVPFRVGNEFCFLNSLIAVEFLRDVPGKMEREIYYTCHHHQRRLISTEGGSTVREHSVKSFFSSTMMSLCRWGRLNASEKLERREKRNSIIRNVAFGFGSRIFYHSSENKWVPGCMDV